jgi:hypothetical protein
MRRVSEQVIDEVNFQRQGKQYADQEAAIEILGSANKGPISSNKSPFLVFFEYGENREGFWAYNNMVLQFEEAVDVLKVIHPTVDLLFCSITVLDIQNNNRMDAKYNHRA